MLILSNDDITNTIVRSADFIRGRTISLTTDARIGRLRRIRVRQDDGDALKRVLDYALEEAIQHERPLTVHLLALAKDSLGARDNRRRRSG